eukprot:1712136-Pleurochrysis_carterae.AAC.1
MAVKSDVRCRSRLTEHVYVTFQGLAIKPVSNEATGSTADAASITLHGIRGLATGPLSRAHKVHG